MGRRLAKLILVCACALALSEIALRRFWPQPAFYARPGLYQADPYLGHVMRPGTVSEVGNFAEFTTRVHINGLGLRGPEPGPRDPNAGPGTMDRGNMRLRKMHPQSHQGVCADAIATLEGITREAVDALALESQKRADAAIRGGHFAKALIPVYKEDGTLALDHEEFPRPQTTLEGLSQLKPAFEALMKQ